MQLMSDGGKKKEQNMKKDVLLKISGMQFTADNNDLSDPEPIEIIAPGEYYFKNGKHYIYMTNLWKALTA